MASSSVADDTAASVIPLIPLKKREKRTTRRAKTSRKRKAKVAAEEEGEYPASATPLASEFLIPPEFLSAEDAVPEPPVTPPPPAAARDAGETAVAPSRKSLAAVLLSISAVALAVVGITINGWFARSLGSSDIAGWLFLAVGVAADLVALVMPSCAAGLWQTGQRATALVGWAGGHFLPEWAELSFGEVAMFSLYGALIWRFGFGPEDRLLFSKTAPS